MSFSKRTLALLLMGLALLTSGAKAQSTEPAEQCFSDMRWKFISLFIIERLPGSTFIDLATYFCDHSGDTYSRNIECLERYASLDRFNWEKLSTPRLESKLTDVFSRCLPKEGRTNFKAELNQIASRVKKSHPLPKKFFTAYTIESRKITCDTESEITVCGHITDVLAQTNIRPEPLVVFNGSEVNPEGDYHIITGHWLDFSYLKGKWACVTSKPATSDCSFTRYDRRSTKILVLNTEARNQLKRYIENEASELAEQ
ncbi:MAG: hypothetical protein AB1540_15930 [Bdellovibrionota bacterium]